MAKPKLAFRKDGSFLIAQLTDLHLSDGNVHDQKTVSLARNILEAEKPDFVALTGDIVMGVGGDHKDSAKSWSMAVAPIEEMAIPWAAALGNHDEEGHLDRAGLLRHQRKFAHCLSEPGPKELAGEGNYVLSVASKSGKPGARLFFLDSLTHGNKAVGGYPWVSFGQVNWFREQAAKSPKLPGLAFLHIPLPEYDEVWRTRPCHGHKFESVCCAPLNSGLFTAMLESGAIEGVFAGHDHINDYIGDLHGIKLCYGRGGGFNTYGKAKFPKGARMIRIREGEKSFETWLRLEDGAKVTEQPLHRPEFPVKK